MGDIADYYIECMLERDEYLGNIEISVPNYSWWRTKDNTSIHIESMGDSHIANCINLLKTHDQHPYTDGWINALELEQLRRMF